jgi:hypothetical protein
MLQMRPRVWRRTAYLSPAHTQYPHSAEIIAEDGRLLWDNMFVDTVSPAAGLSKLGPVPAPPATPGLANYASTNTQTIDTQAIIEALGYQPVMQGDTVVWLPIGGVLALPPVPLDNIVQPPVEPEDENGNRNVTTTYESRFQPGLGATLEGRSYAMDQISVNLATNVASGWTAQLKLRAVAAT